MLHLPCAHCHLPKRLDELQAWVFRDAYCSVACAEAAAPGAPPTARTLLASAVGELHHAIRLSVIVGDKAVAASDARLRAERAMHAGGLFGMAAGGAVGAHAQAEFERLENEIIDHMWKLQQHCITVLRDFMGLNALGYTALVAEIQPLVVTYAGMLEPTHHPAVDHMQQLRAYLSHLHTGTTGLLSQL